MPVFLSDKYFAIGGECNRRGQIETANKQIAAEAGWKTVDRMSGLAQT